MRLARTIVGVGCGVVSLLLLLPIATASAQGSIRRPMLGGYGSATVARSYRSGAGGTLLPSAGGQGNFIPEGSLEPRPSVASAMSPSRIEQTPIGGMSGARTPIGGSSLMLGRGYPAFGSRGMAAMGGVIRSSPVGRRSVMPPRLASPSMSGGG